MNNSMFRMLFLLVFCFLLVMPVTIFAQEQQQGYELPFHPEKFKPAEGWKGKTVLVELFTGSECGPCVAADLGFDGLIEAYDTQYLAVLVYHLPIPGPDPMMNPATKLRQEYYGVRSTPSTYFEGERKHSGGGGLSRAKQKYDEYTSTIDSVVSALPQTKLLVSARLEENIVKVSWSADKEIKAADYNFALVQKEEKYAGRNRITSHKMVVRDFMTLNFDSPAEIAFNISEAEAAAKKHLQDYEKQRGFEFEEMRCLIDPAQLQIVFFLQDKESKSVHNAVVADVIVK